jgi:hypothetical protein
MAAISERQLAAYLKQAGFAEDRIPLMVNIARRESGLNPQAHNPNRATGDNSYGLFQINMIDNLGPARLKDFASFGVSSYEDLKDPWKNVQAAKRVFDSQGINAWTTAKAAAADPAPSFAGSALDAATSGTSGDPLGAMVSSLLEDTLRESTRKSSAGGQMAARSGFLEQLQEANPGVAAQVAAVAALAPRPASSASAVEGASGLTDAMASGSGAPAAGGGGLEVLEYLTGDPSHGGYRADHGGANYHEHLAFKSREQRDAAMQKLKAAGIQIGSVNDGKHAPGSYHYQDLAFDVPAAQVPVGQEQQLSRRVREILGMA